MNNLIAHRGWSGIAPKNTLAAIKLALEENKINVIEIDVHLSKDGIPVVIHDFILNRTTNGKGRVIDYTKNELKVLDARGWFHSNYEGEQIPTLEEVFELVGTKKKLLIELKQVGSLYRGLEEKVIKLIHDYHVEDTVSLISFDHNSLLKAKEIDPTIRRTMVIMGSPVLLQNQIKYVEADAVSINYHFIEKNLVNLLKELDINIIVWTVDNKVVANHINTIDESIAITTNHPEWLW
ncbi:Glycerophosphoryl diester phosphodiesterase OS=Ureibacillus acetophenoni OX=614649 GN=SAMN05877842_105182 PE=4 SV=1 [Ureibacillus acetophenoni]